MPCIGEQCSVIPGMQRRKRHNQPGSQEDPMLRTWMRMGLVFGLLALLTVGAFVLRLPTRPDISQATVDLIQCGMTKGEVEAILGAPPGDYSTGPVWVVGCIATFGWECSMCTDETWTSDDGTITVRFRQDGRVATRPLSTEPMVIFQEGVSARLSFLDRIRQWIGL
jgi:hypothetical protein